MCQTAIAWSSNPFLSNRANNFFRVVARIDADRAFRLFTANDAGVLLECCHCHFFDDHKEGRVFALRTLYFVLPGIILRIIQYQSTKYKEQDFCYADMH